MEKMGGNMDRETRNTGRDNMVTGGILGGARSGRETGDWLDGGIGLGPDAFCGGNRKRNGKKNKTN